MAIASSTSASQNDEENQDQNIPNTSTNEIEISVHSTHTNSIHNDDNNEQNKHDEHEQENKENEIEIEDEEQNLITNDIEISEQEIDHQHEDEHEHEYEEDDETKLDEEIHTTSQYMTHQQEEEEEEEAEHTPLQQSQKCVEQDLNKTMTENKIYNEYMRRQSISTSDIPHSLQILTPQHESRPKDDMLAQIHDMGFDRDLAERAYNALLTDNNGDQTAFTTEQVIEMMLISADLDNNNHDDNDNMQLQIQMEQDHEQEEEEEDEEEEIIVTKGGPNPNHMINTDHDTNMTGDYMECPICRIDRDLSEIHRTSCGHNYCKICLETHYKTSIENGIVSFNCMNEECERIIDETELFLFISSTDNNDIHKTKYYKFLRNVKLAKDPNIRWCVAAGCDTPIKRKSRKQIKMECDKCGTIVCYNCAGLYYNNGNNKNKHDCNKSLDDKLTSWAKTTGQDVQFCPKCFVRIEKLEGCNHMQCIYCKYEFCWLCRKEFKKGHYDPSNILFGCPGGENSNKKPNKCSAFCLLIKSCSLMCCLPARICWWRMNEQGFPWCCCWCCCQD